MRRVLALVLLLAAAVALPADAGAETSKVCEPVVNPYEGTRYDGVDLRKIRAIGVPCSKARDVARRAHRKAIGMSVPESGIRRFRWKGWVVTGDIRREVDRYVAERGDDRVRWVF
jgi:hypothetical protein